MDNVSLNNFHLEGCEDEGGNTVTAGQAFVKRFGL